MPCKKRDTATSNIPSRPVRSPWFLNIWVNRKTLASSCDCACGSVGTYSRMCGAMLPYVFVLANGFSFFFCTNKRKTKQKENSPAAFFGLLRWFIPLNKKNSLRSNSFLFLTLHKAPPLHGKKMRPDLNAFRNIASLVFYCKVHRKSNDINMLRNNHLKQRSAFEFSFGVPAFSGEAWRKMEVFPWRTKSCLSEASSFRLGKTSIF